MKHQKHSKITRKNNGKFALNELAVLGANCMIISNLVNDISIRLSSNYKTAYLDASHAKDTAISTFDTFTFHSKGELFVNKNVNINNYNERVRLAEYDVTFINGNHFEGEKQIVILDSQKETSIEKRIDQINDILFFIAKDKDSYVFDCLKNKFNTQDIRIISLESLAEISNEIEKYLIKSKPKLNGLVLIGGKSLRMGTDKAKLNYHGKDHSIYLADLLHKKTKQTFFSVKNKGEYVYPVIEDRFIDLGPFGAICSAFLKNPNEAYFVLATDLPFINEELIDLLIQNRDTTKIATTVKGKSKQFSEPLITIWEPKAYPVLLNYLAQGISCPRKVLINSDTKILDVDDQLITNVNTLEEFYQIKENL